MSTTSSEVQYGTTTIPYTIRRSTRRATVALAVDPQAGVVLTAPAATPVARLDAVVKEKARWILGHLRRRDDLQPAVPSRDYVGGETYMYLGRQYRLRIVESEHHVGPLRLKDGWLVLPAPRLVTDGHRADYVRAALLDWYTLLAHRQLRRRTTTWAAKEELPMPRVAIAKHEKSWARCSAGTIRYNWRIVQAPGSLIDYVVAHEICHLVHEHHGRAFWAMLGRLMPDYEARKNRLREVGPRLEW
jgi:predicted metal-dependent hydrolase